MSFKSYTQSRVINEITVILPPALKDVKLSCAVINQKKPNKYSCLEKILLLQSSAKCVGLVVNQFNCFWGSDPPDPYHCQKPPQKGGRLWAGVQPCDA